MTPNNEFVVKHSGVWGSSIVGMGTRLECDARAAELNRMYQTDEYKVEAWKDGV